MIALAIAAVAVGWGIWHFSIRAGRPGEAIRNVLLISIDTCRADHLSCYGYTGQATPNVDALARDGVRFTSVTTPFPMTLPAHCSMLTGTYPEVHGVRGNFARLGDTNVTLAKVLGAAGYQTAAFVGGFPLAARFGLNQGFQTYDDQFPKAKDLGGEAERTAEEVSRPAMTWLEKHGGQPFFLFLHYYDPHYRYDPPPPFPATYDGELAYVDVWIGRVMDKLRELGLYDNTLVVLAGDHGEGLGEHGEKEHGFLIYQNTLHVPLIVRLPGGPRGSRVDENASLVDVVPTVLGLTGVSIPTQVQGVDLSGNLAGAPRPDGPRLIYSETLWPEEYGCSPLYGVLDGTWKYIECPKPELYNLSQDGGEKVNLVDKQPQVAHRLRSRLEEWQRAMASAAKPHDGANVPLGKDTLRQLESLGYVGGGTGAAGSGSNLNLEDPKDFIPIFERCKAALELMGTHRYEEAKNELLVVVSRRPRLVLAHLWLGEIATLQSLPAEAIRELTTALSILAESRDSPSSSAGKAKSTQAMHCHRHLGRALLMEGKLDQAAVEYQNAFRMDPESFEDHLTLIDVLCVRGRFSEAVAHCQKVLETAPLTLPVGNKLVWILATCPEASVRNGAKAVEMGKLLVQGTGSRDPVCLDTLAAAYAESRQFPQAVAAAEEALALANSAQQKILALDIQSRLELYRAGRPYREAPKKPPNPAAP